MFAKSRYLNGMFVVITNNCAMGFALGLLNVKICRESALYVIYFTDNLPFIY